MACMPSGHFSNTDSKNNMRGLLFLRICLVIAFLLWVPYRYLAANFEHYGLTFPNYYLDAWQQNTSAVQIRLNPNESELYFADAGPFLPGRYRLALTDGLNPAANLISSIDITDRSTASTIHRLMLDTAHVADGIEINLPAASNLDIHIVTRQSLLMESAHLDITRVQIHSNLIWPSIINEYAKGFAYFSQTSAY